MGILLSKWSLADVAVEPLVGDQFKIGPAEASVKLVAADGDPGRVMEASAGVDTGGDDIEEPGKFPPDPRSAVVLVRNGVDPELGDECIDLFGAAGGADLV